MPAAARLLACYPLALAMAGKAGDINLKGASLMIEYCQDEIPAVPVAVFRQAQPGAA